MSRVLNDNLEWSAIADLEAGEHFTLGPTSPLTFTCLGAYVTARGTVEVEASCLAGIRDGRAFTKRFFKPQLSVLIVPDEYVGERVGSAVEAFKDRQFTGNDHIELASGIWPWSLESDDSDYDVIDLAEVSA